MVYTLGEAAKATGKTKSALSKALGKGRISGIKNDAGEWEIDPAELHRVYPAISKTPLNAAEQETPVNTDSSAEIKLLEAKLEAALEQIDGLRADKTFLQTELSKVNTLLADQRQKEAEKPAKGRFRHAWAALTSKS